MFVLKSYTVEKNETPKRFIDAAIGVFSGFETRNSVKKGIKKNRFTVNGEKAETGTWVHCGDRIDLLERSDKPKRYDRDIEIVFEDDYLALVNKPAGMVVSGNQFKTLEHCLIDQLNLSSQEDALDWALPVHRLDSATSGLVVFAKTISARRRLGEMLEQKQIKKTYHAIVHGVPQLSRIDSNVNGKQAASTIQLVRSVPSLKNEQLSLVKLEPITGRTHQLRVHCHSIGSAIVGDQLYNNESGTFRNKGLFLAATEIAMKHPCKDEPLRIRIPLPNKFESLLQRESRRSEKYK